MQYKYKLQVNANKTEDISSKYPGAVLPEDSFPESGLTQISKTRPPPSSSANIIQLLGSTKNKTQQYSEKYLSEYINIRVY